MRVKLRTMVAGPGYAYTPGQVADIEREDAQALIDGGYAEAVPVSRVRTAEAPTPERQAVEPEPEAPIQKPKRRRRR
jgi:hypothetical protein